MIKDILCRCGLHSWRDQWESHANPHSVFHTRRCQRCGRGQIHEFGLIGDKRWHNLEGYNFKWSWERENFATPVTKIHDWR